MKKLKIVALFAALLTAPVVTFAQAFADGNNLISLGFGLPPGQRLTDNYTDLNTKPGFIHSDYRLKNYGTGVLKYEHGLSKYFGMGLNLEYSAATRSYDYDTDINAKPPYRYQINTVRTVFAGYLRLNGHFPVGEKLDFYGGVGLGYIYTTDKYSDTNPNNSNSNQKKTVLDFDYQITVGARYMVKNSFGLFAEFGYATTLAQIGFQFKF
jgi:hypothetical protein